MTAIQWTDRTWNPIRGCSLVSEGCRNCYAMKQAHRFSGPGRPYAGLTELGPAGPRWTGRVSCDEGKLLEPLAWRTPARVFVNSMSDLFHEAVPFEFVDRVFAVMALARRHTFQILTKRPARMLEYFTRPGVTGNSREVVINGAIWSTLGTRRGSRIKHGGAWRCTWPLPNVWLGVSAEHQAAADERIPLLLQTPAAVRFLSAEPLLGAIDLTNITAGSMIPQRPEHRVDVLRAGTWELRSGLTRVSPEFINHSDMERLDWVIVGGESGPAARPCYVLWLEAIAKECQAAGVPVFVKQLGARPRWAGARSVPIEHARGKCDNPLEWPPELRVREWPEVAHV